jgi:hypothetical protein
MAWLKHFFVSDFMRDLWINLLASGIWTVATIAIAAWWWRRQWRPTRMHAIAQMQSKIADTYNRVVPMENLSKSSRVLIYDGVIVITYVLKPNGLGANLESQRNMQLTYSPDDGDLADKWNEHLVSLIDDIDTIYTRAASYLPHSIVNNINALRSKRDSVTFYTTNQREPSQSFIVSRFVARAFDDINTLWKELRTWADEDMDEKEHSKQLTASIERLRSTIHADAKTGSAPTPSEDAGR